jgi:phosphomannomutase
LQFGTAGIRALMGMGTTRLNNYTCAQIFHAYAKYLKKYYTVGDIKILIGHDNRNNSFGFSMLAARVFNSYGIKVVLFKKNILIPTPIVSYTIRSIGAAGGINITASHNPKEYNGIKFYLSDGTQITTEDVEISQLMCNPNEIINTNFNFELTNVEYLSNNIISQYFYDAKNAQIDHISVHNDQKKYPIIVATNQGTMSKLFPKYIKKILGFKKVHPVKNQAKIDPNFTFTPYPNPEDPRSFEQAKILADRKNSDICIGVDPDGDRMAVCIKKNGT